MMMSVVVPRWRLLRRPSSAGRGGALDDGGLAGRGGLEYGGVGHLAIAKSQSLLQCART